VDAEGKRTIDLLRVAPGIRLEALFSPEHGIEGDLDRKIPNGVDPATGLPIFSLYGDVKRPTDSMLSNLDALVFDIQDAGARFYTYATTLGYALEAAARNRLRFIVLDRPNPLGGTAVQGPVLDRDLISFVGYHPIPIRHGMTIGELAHLFNSEKRIGANLEVVSMRGYTRRLWYDETGWTWRAPSPNLPTFMSAILYPAVAVVEGANISVGRGTSSPFEVLGAPWVNGANLAAYLARRDIRGVKFEAITFTPASGPFKGRKCHGIRIRVLERDQLDVGRLGYELANALYSLHSGKFDVDRILGMLGSRAALAALKSHTKPYDVVRGWDDSLRAFRELRARYLSYE
jgi:uncharacterized protein YbbC (DUF1343 family)